MSTSEKPIGIKRLTEPAEGDDELMRTVKGMTAMYFREQDPAATRRKLDPFFHSVLSILKRRETA